MLPASGGVVRLRDGVFSFHPATAALGGTPLRYLFVEPNGTLWLGGNGATLMRWQDGRLITFGAEEHYVVRHMGGRQCFAIDATVARGFPAANFSAGIGRAIDSGARRNPVFHRDRSGPLRWDLGGHRRTTAEMGGRPADGRVRSVVLAAGQRHPSNVMRMARECCGSPRAGWGCSGWWTAGRFPYPPKTRRCAPSRPTRNPISGWPRMWRHPSAAAENLYPAQFRQRPSGRL